MFLAQTERQSNLIQRISVKEVGIADLLFYKKKINLLVKAIEKVIFA